MKDKYVLGLDIGIASVGWAVLDRNTHDIIESGVSLFQDGRRKTNAERRAFRSGKRIAHRRKVRLKDAKSFLNELGYYEDNTNTNPYSLRVKGINGKLTKSEFYTAYMHLVKHRGSSFETVDTDVNEDDERSAKSNLQINERLIKEGKYPCEIQMMKFEETGKIRGFDNVFKTKHYVLELKQILKNQDFSPKQEEKLIHFIERRRSFEEGPGSLKSPSKYGRFIKLNDGSIQKINLIEKMRGHCSVYPEELRAPKNSFSAELFNFLNDLNNLTIFQDNIEYKLSSNQKEDIIDTLVYSNKLPGATPKQLAKFIDVPLETISGFRIDTKEKPLLSEFKGTRSILKALGDSFLLIGNEDTFDLISEILTQTKVLESRVEKLTEQFETKLSKKQIEDLSQLPGISQYHNLSLKVIKELREQQILEAKNHMQLLSERNLLKNDLEQYVGKKNIQFDDSLVFNPIVKRSIRQSFKIINAVRKKYGELDAIIIEMPRDNSPEDEKKRMRDTHKQNELINKQVLDVAKKAVGGLLTDKQLKGKARMKVRLYMQQDGKCLYSGEPLSLNDIVRGTDSYEIDHVIPISVSFDDSFNNKVLVTHQANQEKGQKTPYQAFNENKIKGWGYKGYYSHIFDLLQRKLIKPGKFSVLTYNEPIDKYENLEKFIARNLVDTRYSSRVVLNTLQSYYKANNLNTSILTIKGVVTNQFRKKVDLPKDRNESYEHMPLMLLLLH